MEECATLRYGYHYFCIHMARSMGVVYSMRKKLIFPIPFMTILNKAKINEARKVYNMEVSVFFSSCPRDEVNALIEDQALPRKLDVGNVTHPFYLNDKIVCMDDAEFDEHVRNSCYKFLMRFAYGAHDSEYDIAHGVGEIMKVVNYYQSFTDDTNA